MRCDDTAIFLFIRDPQEEGRIKQLAGKGAYRKGTEMARQLNAYTKQRIRATGLPYFIITTFDQQGTTFGERLANAFQKVFDYGYDKVIALGNDHPGLQTNDITQAAEALQETGTVLGPAKDGGLYLIGLNRTGFDPGKFEALPWQTAELYRHFTNHLQSHHIAYRLLPALKDTDSFEQLFEVLRELSGQKPFSQICETLKRLIGDGKQLFVPEKTPVSNPIRLLPIDMRAPPA